jgi:hypothetical protein
MMRWACLRLGTPRRREAMRHKREEVIKRTIAEHRRLDRLVASLSEADWKRLLPRR